VIDIPDNEVCESCGALVEARREGSVQGVFCTRCDWAVVTTWLPEILRDETLYEVKVVAGDYKNEKHIKAIAKLKELNFLAARKLLQTESSFVVFNGKAAQLVDVRGVLISACMEYVIRPEFLWRQTSEKVA